MRESIFPQSFILREIFGMKLCGVFLYTPDWCMRPPSIHTLPLSNFEPVTFYEETHALNH